MLPTPYYDVDGITIYHGDCREILPHLPMVDLVLTDPPYGIGMDKAVTMPIHKNKFGKVRTSANYGFADWDSQIPPKIVFDTMLKISKNQIIYGGNYFTEYLYPTNSWIFWDKKNNPQNGKTFSDGELIWTSLSFPMKKITYGWIGFDYINNPSKEVKQHPSQKPTPIIGILINLVDCDTILDPFMGSGTTLVAAKQLHRKAIGIEIEQRYCDIAIKRLSQGVLDLSIESNSRAASNHERPSPSLDGKNRTIPQGLFGGEHRRDVENI